MLSSNVFDELSNLRREEVICVEKNDASFSSTTQPRHKLIGGQNMEIDQYFTSSVLPAGLSSISTCPSSSSSSILASRPEEKTRRRQRTLLLAGQTQIVFSAASAESHDATDTCPIMHTEQLEQDNGHASVTSLDSDSESTTTAANSEHHDFSLLHDHLPPSTSSTHISLSPHQEPHYYPSSASNVVRVVGGIAAMENEDQLKFMLPSQNVRPKATLKPLKHLLHGLAFNPVWLTLHTDPRARSGTSIGVGHHFPIRLLANRVYPTRDILECYIAKVMKLSFASAGLELKRLFARVFSTPDGIEVVANGGEADATHDDESPVERKRILLARMCTRHAKTHIFFCMLPHSPAAANAPVDVSHSTGGVVVPDVGVYTPPTCLDGHIYALQNAWCLAMEPVVFEAPASYAEESYLLPGCTRATPISAYRTFNNEDLTHMADRIGVQVETVPLRDQRRMLSGNTSALLAYRVRQFAYPQAPLATMLTTTIADASGGTVHETDDPWPSTRAPNQPHPFRIMGLHFVDPNDALAAFKSILRDIGIVINVKNTDGHWASFDENQHVIASCVDEWPTLTGTKTTVVARDRDAPDSPLLPADESFASTANRCTLPPPIILPRHVTPPPLEELNPHACYYANGDETDAGHWYNCMTWLTSNDSSPFNNAPQQVCDENSMHWPFGSVVVGAGTESNEQELAMMMPPSNFISTAASSTITGPTTMDIDYGDFDYASADGNAALAHLPQLATLSTGTSCAEALEETLPSKSATAVPKSASSRKYLASSSTLKPSSTQRLLNVDASSAVTFYATAKSIMVIHRIIDCYRSILPKITSLAADASRLRALTARGMGHVTAAIQSIASLPNSVSMAQSVVVFKSIGLYIDDYNTIASQVASRIESCTEVCASAAAAVASASPLLRVFNFVSGQVECWPNLDFNPKNLPTLEYSQAALVALTQQPLASYLANHFMNTDGTGNHTSLNAKWLTANPLVHKAPTVTGVQHEQMADAYYWAYLAPVRNPAYEQILAMYRHTGISVRLKNGYQRTGVHSGRLEAPGKPRNYAPRRMHHYTPSADKMAQAQAQRRANATTAASSSSGAMGSGRSVKSKYHQLPRQSQQSPFTYHALALQVGATTTLGGAENLVAGTVASAKCQIGNRKRRGGSGGGDSTPSMVADTDNAQKAKERRPPKLTQLALKDSSSSMWITTAPMPFVD